MAKLIQPSFAKGEISPSLDGRVDIAAYRVGLKTASNAVIHATGGASNRAGLKFIAPCGQFANAPRLIPFKFNTVDTYVLEFGDLYMRVIRNDALVLGSDFAVDITGVSLANPAVVTVSPNTDNYSAGAEIYISGIVGTTELNNRHFTVTSKTSNTLTLESFYTGAAIDATAYTAWSSGGTVTFPYGITTPYTQADLAELKFVQSADEITITHPNYAVRTLSRLDHDNWELNNTSFRPTTLGSSGVSVTVNTAGAVTDRYQVTVTNLDTGEESYPFLASGSTISEITDTAFLRFKTSAAHNLVDNDEVELNFSSDISQAALYQLTDRRFVINVIDADEFQIESLSGVGLGLVVGVLTGTTRSALPTFKRVTTSAVTRDNTVTWNSAGGGNQTAYRYNIYREKNGVFGFIGSSDGLTFEDDNIDPATDISPPRYVEVFRDTDTFPGCSGYFEQRQLFGGSSTEPDTTYYSQTGNFNNFSRSIPGQAADAITATLTSSEVNEIRHFVALNDLLIFTSGAEWRVNAGADTGFSAETIRQKPQTTWGSSHLKPIVSGATVLFVQDGSSRVRSLGYSLQLDGYTGSDLNLLSRHLLEDNTIVDWSYSKIPDPMVFMVRDDGVALTMTFDQEQEVIAWTKWFTDGKFKAVCTSRPDPDVADDPAYFVVQRIVDGVTIQCVERLASRVFSDVRDCFFVDSGKTLDSPITITGSTAANPVVITATSHGFVNGDEVDISNIEWTPVEGDFRTFTQPSQLNGLRFIVANKTANTFELTDLDGNNVDGSAYTAYVAGGEVRKAVQEVTGLEHLHGETLVGLLDGNVAENLEANAAGAVTLPYKASRVHVGLPFVCDLETLNIEVPQGTIQGRQKLIPSVTIRFDETGGAVVGPDETHLTEIKWRSQENWDDPVALLSGDQTVNIEANWNSTGRILIRQHLPKPMTVLAVIPDLEVGDE